jgi:hypothetical protein
MKQPWREPTMEELDALIAHQYANLPSWWESANPKEKETNEEARLERIRQRSRRQKMKKRPAA